MTRGCQDEICKGAGVLSTVDSFALFYLACFAKREIIIYVNVMASHDAQIAVKEVIITDIVHYSFNLNFNLSQKLTRAC